MHSTLVIIHSLLRWVILALILFKLYQAYSGWFGKKEWTPLDKKVSIFSIIAVDTQLLIGLILYFGTGPYFKMLTSKAKVVMKNGVLRFWAVEHIFMMIIAVILIHVGHALSKRAEDSILKHKKAAIFFTIGLLLMLAAIPWPFMKAARPLLPF